MTTLRDSLKRTYWLSSSQFGINPLVFFRALREIPRYISDYRNFKRGNKGKLEFLPCLHDRYQEGGVIKNEYFWQDLLVARMISAAKPDKHADIGSRIDGFVAHVASFREIEVFDIRPVSTRIPGVTFRQADLMQSVVNLANHYDSVSCLHALEHFGLGRYGDPVDPEGFYRGFNNIASLLKNNGVLYLSVPIGIDRVEFNGLRVSDPRTIITMANENSLSLISLIFISQTGTIENIPMNEINAQINEAARQRYKLGVFTFTKSS